MGVYIWTNHIRGKPTEKHVSIKKPIFLQRGWIWDLDTFFFILSWVVYLNLCGPRNILSEDRGTTHTGVCSSANLESWSVALMLSKGGLKR